jgi:hypothetical protein
VECANGGVAELVRSTGPELRALVTDVELGGEMSGVQLARSQYAKRRFPDLSVVYALRPRSVLRSARHASSYEALSAAAATRRRPELSCMSSGAWKRVQ